MCVTVNSGQCFQNQWFIVTDNNEDSVNLFAADDGVYYKLGLLHSYIYIK